MNLNEYIQATETVRTQTSAARENDSRKGTLAVTDMRLVFSKRAALGDTRVLDIDLSRIDEIEYHLNPINWNAAAGAVLSAIGTAFVYLNRNSIAVLSDGFDALVMILGAFLSVVFVLSIIYYRKETLIVRTPSDNHTFRGGDFENFPHAIRAGA